MAVRVLLADDHVMIRQCMRLALERDGYEVLGEADDGHEAIKMCEKLRPDVALLDVSMPGLNGIDAAQAILKAGGRIKVLLVTMHREDCFVLSALRSGIHGYILKNRALSELLQALRSVWKGEIYLSPAISRTLIQRLDDTVPDSPLSNRERQILQLIAEGKTSKEVATILGISANTVESHRAKIMQTLDIHETAGLVRYAMRHGLTEL